MKCPACSTVMVAGTVNVARSTLGTITEVADVLLGGSVNVSQYLYFHLTTGRGTVCVVDGTKKAFRCEKCHVVVILE
jgi:hypothetical protein